MKVKEISEDEARGRKDQYRERRDKEKEKRDETVEDKESIEAISQELEFPGFSEAGEQIREGVSSAGDATDQRFEEQDQDAIENVFTPQKEHEEELGERSNGAAGDIEKIAQGNLRTDTAQAELDKARSAAEEGKEKIDTLEDEQMEEREEGEQDRDEQKDRLRNIKIEFNT